MIIRIDKSFDRDQKKIRDRKILLEIVRIIESAKSVSSIDQIPGIKKLKGFKEFYRIRIGDFRVGIVVKGNVIEFIRILNRKEIYRFFP